MAKFSVDDILKRVERRDQDGDLDNLSTPPSPAPARPASPAPARSDAGTTPAAPGAPGGKPVEPAANNALAKQPRHRIDNEEEAFSPLPSMPANQRAFGGESALVRDDPSVKKHIEAPTSSVGPALSSVFPAASDDNTRGELGEVLLARGVVTGQQIQLAQNVLKQSPGRRLVEVLLEQGADEAAIQKVSADVSGIGFERIDLKKGVDGGFDGKLAQRLGPDFCKEHMVIPLRQEGSRVVIGATRADDVFLRDDLKQRLGAPIKIVLVTSHDIKGALDVIGAPTQEEAVDLSEILSEVEEGDVQVEKANETTVDLTKEAGGGPVIRYVNHIIQTAVKEGASDIHVEPGEKKMKVRFRIDGELYEMMQPPASMQAAITSRIKIMAGLDISERRLPQDGRIRCTVQGRKLDLRVSTLPAGTGEKTVMRILDTRSINVKLDDLGFYEDTLVVWKKLIDAPHGIVLVTGPTGSGKTTTLYSSLRQLDKNSMNISTVEDPVEYHLDGITQTQTHEKIGMTFAMALRALLRQDPDVIMLGEIRDMETASIAVQAALTGHLVLSTLHTNDAPSSITRLVNIGLEPFLVGAAVNGVLAQRLVRKLCVHCKKQQTPSEDLVEFLEVQGLNTEQQWTHVGCDRCRQNGYSGRVGIYELLAVDDQLRDIIARNPNVAEFRRLCLERGMVPLRGDGLKKVDKGITTVQEILRVTEAH